jgi:hypothetical protein
MLHVCVKKLADDTSLDDPEAEHLAKQLLEEESDFR